MKNRIWKPGKQRIENQASKNQASSVAPGLVVEWSIKKWNAFDELHKDTALNRTTAGSRNVNTAIALIEGARISEIRGFPGKIDLAKDGASSIPERLGQGVSKIRSCDHGDGRALFGHLD